MVKRFISSNASEILSMTAPELKQSIKASEGRVILSENVAFKESYIGDVTNAEIARSFGADLILLNGIDIFQPLWLVWMPRKILLRSCTAWLVVLSVSI